MKTFLAKFSKKTICLWIFVNMKYQKEIGVKGAQHCEVQSSVIDVHCITANWCNCCDVKHCPVAFRCGNEVCIINTEEGVPAVS